MRKRLTTYNKTLPDSKYKTVVLIFPEKATINETNRIIILIPLQPSITLAKYLPSSINFIDGSFGCGITCVEYPKFSSKFLDWLATKLVM